MENEPRRLLLVCVTARKHMATGSVIHPVEAHHIRKAAHPPLPNRSLLGMVIGREEIPDIRIIVIRAQFWIAKSLSHLHLKARPSFRIGRRIVDEGRHEIYVMLNE